MYFTMSRRGIHAIQGEGWALVFLTFTFRMGNHSVGTMLRTMGGPMTWNPIPRSFGTVYVLTAATLDVHHSRQGMSFAVEGGLLSFVVERRVCRTSNDSVASLLRVLTAAIFDVHHARQGMDLAVDGFIFSFMVERRSCRTSWVLTAGIFDVHHSG